MKTVKNLPAIVLIMSATAAAGEVNKAVDNASKDVAPVGDGPIKKLNQQNQVELRALIMEKGGETAADDIKAIDDKKLSVAKTRQELINLAASCLPEDQVFGTPKTLAAEAKTNAKLEANTAVLVAAGFVEAEGKFTKEGSEIVVTSEEAGKLTAKQLEAKMTPKAPKEEFKGYTEEDKAKLNAAVNCHVTFRPSSRYGDAVKTNDDGTVDGIVKSWKIESRSERVYVEIKVPGLEKTAWTRDTSAGFKVGKKATDAELIAAKLMKEPKVEAPAATPAPEATPAATETPKAGKAK